MIWSVATSRRATAFAQALDGQERDAAATVGQAAGEGAARVLPPGAGGAEGAEGGGIERSPGDDDTDGTDPALLLAVADRLNALPRPGLTPEVKTVQRAQLIAAMEAAAGSPETLGDQVPEQRTETFRRGTHRAPALSPLGRFRPTSRLAKGLAAGGLGVGVAASALGGVAAASTEALPGDALYGLKRGMEGLQLDLANDESDRGQVHLDHASTRLQEARRLMERTRRGAALDHESMSEVRKALSGMRYDATEGHRLLSEAYRRDGRIASMRSLSSFATSHRASWAKLRDRLPSQLTDVGDGVSSVFDAIDSDVGPLAGLMSESPKHGSGKHRRAGAGGKDGSRTAPQPTSSTGSAGSDGRAGKSGKPSPSGTDDREGELIGGGGILDPSGHPEGRPSHSVPGNRKVPNPDITLPPIIPDVLPGLKRLSEDERH